MRLMKTSVCLTAGILAICSALANADDDKPHFRKNSVQGAWEVTVTLRAPAADCTTAAVIGVGPNPFQQFYTFHEGGTMNEWGTRAPPATRGAGHGLWKRTGPDDFAYRVLFHSFDVNGLLSNKMDIRADLTLADGGQQFDGVARFVFSDLSGNARNFCATMVGTRLTL